MFGAIGLLAPLLIVLFSAVRVRGDGDGGCVVVAKWNWRPLLAVATVDDCTNYPFSYERLHNGAVTYYPPDDSHGPARVVNNMWKNDDLVEEPRENGRTASRKGSSTTTGIQDAVKVDQENGVIEKEMDFQTEEQAISWLRRTLNIQCTLLFESPDSLGKSSWFLIIDISKTCSEFVELLKTTHILPVSSFRSITFDAGDKDVAPRRLCRGYFRVILDGLASLQLTRGEDLNKDVIRYRTVAASPDFGPFPLLPVTQFVESYDLNVQDGQVKVDVEILYYGQSEKYKFLFEAVLAEWDEKWPKSKKVGILGIMEIFQKTPLQLQFTRCNLEEDPLCESRQLLDVTDDLKRDFWSTRISKLRHEGENWQPNLLYMPEEYILNSLAFLESLEGAKAWVKSLFVTVNGFNVAFAFLGIRPYESIKSGSRSRHGSSDKNGGRGGRHTGGGSSSRTADLNPSNVGSPNRNRRDTASHLTPSEGSHVKSGPMKRSGDKRRQTQREHWKQWEQRQ